jgi:hypothetical protein
LCGLSADPVTWDLRETSRASKIALYFLNLVTQTWDWTIEYKWDGVDQTCPVDLLTNSGDNDIQHVLIQPCLCTCTFDVVIDVRKILVAL